MRWALRLAPLLALIWLCACPPSQHEDPVEVKKKFFNHPPKGSWGLPEHPLIEQQRERRLRQDAYDRRAGRRDIDDRGNVITLNFNEVDLGELQPGETLERQLTLRSTAGQLTLSEARFEGDCCTLKEDAALAEAAPTLRLVLRLEPGLPAGDFAGRLHLAFSGRAPHTLDTWVYGRVRSAWKVVPQPRPLRGLHAGRRFEQRYYLFAPGPNAIDHVETGDSRLTWELHPIEGHEQGQYLLTVTIPPGLPAGTILNSSLRIVPQYEQDAFRVALFGQVAP